MVTEGISVTSFVSASSAVYSLFVPDVSVGIVTEGLGEGVCVTEDVEAAECSNEFDKDAPSLW